MNRTGPSLVAGLALCSILACSKEVTVHLLESGADAGGDSGDGQAAGFPGGPCQKLGPEVCNGGDDDCNGAVDEGCAHTITWTRELNTDFLGHATGGVTFLEPCPPGSVLTGFRIGMGHWLNQVAAVCRQLAVNATDAGDAGELTIALGNRFDPSFVPAASKDTTNQVTELLCPDGLTFAGAEGTTSEDEPRYIKGLRITCAPPVVTTSASGAVVDLDRALDKMVGPVLCGECAATQAYNYSTTTAAGHVATGVFGAAGLWIDRMGFDASLGRVVGK